MKNTIKRKMSSHKTTARIFGIFYILTFLSYGIGKELIDS